MYMIQYNAGRLLLRRSTVLSLKGSLMITLQRILRNDNLRIDI
jgi:hypothetical protein